MLHVLACDQLAGTELMVASLITRSDSGVVRHELATLAPPGPIAERVGVAARSLGGGGGLPGAAWRLARLLRSRDYDVVNAYGLKASALARVLARLRRPRPAFVCGVRGRHVTDVERLDSAKARLASVAERVLSPLVDVYDSNSRAALGLLAGLGVDDARLVHIPNGLDLDLWAPREREPHGSPPLVLCAARFADGKRQQDLLQALARLADEGRSFRAVLAGAGPNLAAVRDLASQLGLDGAVQFPGPLPPDGVRTLLGEAAIACLPSASEGMPGALMEAMASGVAVVGTDVGGTNELVVDGESGILVQAYDPAALANALARLLDDPDLRQSLAAEGRRRMEECFSLEIMLNAKERLYRDASRRSASLSGVARRQRS